MRRMAVLAVESREIRRQSESRASRNKLYEMYTLRAAEKKKDCPVLGHVTIESLLEAAISSRAYGRARKQWKKHAEAGRGISKKLRTGMAKHVADATYPA